MADELDEQKPLSKEEREEEFRTGYAYLKPDPIYVDHLTSQFSARDQSFRITFGDWIGGDHAPIYRVGVVMPMREARRLHQILTKLLKEEEDRLAKVLSRTNLLTGKSDGG